MKSAVIEDVGWYGVGAVLAAYVLTTLAFIDNESFWFIFLNLTGAVSLMIVSWYKHAIQTLVLNVVWAAIAVVGLINVLL